MVRAAQEIGSGGEGGKDGPAGCRRESGVISTGEEEI